MRRYVPLLIAGCALVVAACSDTIAPKRSTSESGFTRAPVAFSLLSKKGDDAAAKTYTFTINPRGGRARVGDFMLKYGANAVCDPSTSGYGPELWLSACSTLDAPIEITARFWKTDGRTYAEFSPNIRFSPDVDVTLSVVRTDVIARRQDRTPGFYDIWYVQMVNGVRQFIDEASVDPSVATQYDTKTGKVWRRIRHFSGWSVRTGATAEPCEALDGVCDAPAAAVDQ